MHKVTIRYKQKGLNKSAPKSTQLDRNEVTVIQALIALFCPSGEYSVIFCSFPKKKQKYAHAHVANLKF